MSLGNEFSKDYLSFYSDPNPAPDYGQEQRMVHSSKSRGRRRAPPRYFETGASASWENNGQGPPRFVDEVHSQKRDAYYKDHRNDNYRGHHGKNRPQPYPDRRPPPTTAVLEESFEDTMEMDLDNFSPELKVPRSDEEVKYLIELANDASLRCVDAVRILLSIVDVAQWTADVSSAAVYIFNRQWRPAEWYRKLIREPSYVCQPLRKIDYIRVDQPDIHSKLLPSGTLPPNVPTGLLPSASGARAFVRPFNDVNIHPDFDDLSGMLRYLAQTDHRLFGVQLEQNRIIVRQVRGAMLFLGRVPVRNGMDEPTESLDLAFLYACAIIGSVPGRYAAILAAENVYIQPTMTSRSRFPSQDYSDYTPSNVAKFFASQGITPILFDDAFTWVGPFCKKMAKVLKKIPSQSALFNSVFQETLQHPVPRGLGVRPEGGHYPCLPRPPKALVPVITVNKPAHIIHARNTRPADLANSNELAKATSSSLAIVEDISMDIRPDQTANIFINNTTDHYTTQSLLPMQTVIPLVTPASSSSNSASISAPIDSNGNATFPLFGTVVNGVRSLNPIIVSPAYNPFSPAAVTGVMNQQERGVDPKLTQLSTGTAPPKEPVELSQVNEEVAKEQELGSNPSGSVSSEDS
ncbi:hypothetical protein C8J56DRAFT_884676 [Mycena floridula]|nr:hypothetical protein C8J56DRAFT_884676 [Mycena floridula]